MTGELQSTLQASGIELPAMTNHILCMVHFIQLAFSACMSSLGVQGHIKSWEAHEGDQQFGENESAAIGKSRRLQKEGNARINNVLAMQLGLANIIEKVRISKHFKRPATDHHIAENASYVDHADTWSSKWVHWLSKGQSTKCGTTCSGCQNTLEFNTAVAWTSLPITRSHLWVVEESNIQQIPATLHNTECMDARHGRFMAIPILDPVDVEKA